MKRRYQKNKLDMPGVSAFSILELMLTLVIVVLVLTAVLGILNQTQGQMVYLDEYFVRQQRAQEAMDRMMEDIVNASAGHMSLSVQREQAGSMPTARLIIQSAMDMDSADAAAPAAGGTGETGETAEAAEVQPKAPGGKGTLRIDWVAVPRYDQEDLVLFRREKYVDTETADETAMYIPICEHLCEFDVELLDGRNESTENGEQMRTVSLFMAMFRPGEHDADRAVILTQSFCLHRYE